MADEAAIGDRFRLLAGELDERALRLWAAAEAATLGRGGTAVVARATGIAPSTIRRGRAELVSGESPGAGRVRRAGAGRKRLTATDPTLLADLEREGCANSVSCREVVFVDKAAEPDAPLDGGGRRVRGTDRLLGRLGWREIQ